MHPTFNFEHSYLTLPEKLYTRIAPQKVAAPEMLLFNEALADRLGIGYAESSDTELAEVFAGNVLPTTMNPAGRGTENKTASPLAQAYAGHQFGHFTILGDGRAVLLGEQIAPDGRRFDIQLKGSGRTPYSRGGDGRATLSSVLREYLISECMHALGIPCSRSLAVTLTGETVMRERPHPGAILTRVTESHLRTGTFEFARQMLPEKDLSALLDYAVSRHYPELEGSEEKALDFLEAVSRRQIGLICHWMRTGFIHGVMNTDNMHIAGISFDFGPCAFMNAYHPRTVFSSIDHTGRYAFGKQAGIGQWNLGVLAGALLPLIDKNTDTAIEKARAVLNRYPAEFSEAWSRTLSGKIGIAKPDEEAERLGENLLNHMQEARADYTNTFLWLMRDNGESEVAPYNTAPFTEWRARWEKRISREEGGHEAALALMRKHNPRVIPRNHLVEEALSAAEEREDFSPFTELIDAVQHTYNDAAPDPRFTAPPPEGDADYRTFCGT